MTTAPIDLHKLTDALVAQFPHARLEAGQFSWRSHAIPLELLQHCWDQQPSLDRLVEQLDSLFAPLTADDRARLWIHVLPGYANTVNGITRFVQMPDVPCLATEVLTIPDEEGWLFVHPCRIPAGVAENDLWLEAEHNMEKTAPEPEIITRPGDPPSEACVWDGILAADSAWAYARRQPTALVLSPIETWAAVITCAVKPLASAMGI